MSDTGGRPLKEINWEQFNKLCELQCTLEEFASFFDCSEDTIERACEREHGMKFKELFKLKSKRGHVALRRAQWRKAVEKLDNTMLIWLGKQHLKQKDKSDAELDIEKEAAKSRSTPPMTKEEILELVKKARGK